MSAESTLTVLETPATNPSTSPAAPDRSGRPLVGRRPWPAVVLIGVYWALYAVVHSLEKPYFFAFLYNVGSSLVLPLGYFGWWWFSRKIPLRDRAYGFLLLAGGGLIAEPFYHASIGW